MALRVLMVDVLLAAYWGRITAKLTGAENGTQSRMRILALRSLVEQLVMRRLASVLLNIQLLVVLQKTEEM